MRLTLPTGEALSSIHYVVTGPTNTSGDVPIGNAQSIEFVVGGLSAGSGYTVTLTAIDSAGDRCASASAPFSIVAGTTTQAQVNLVCRVESTGKISLGLITPSGTTITSVSYSITGPSTAVGTVDTSSTQSIEFVVGGLVAGTGYTITLTATDSAGNHCASAATPFTIAVGATTEAEVTLVCYLGDGGFVFADAANGSVEFDATVAVVNNPTTVCPAIASFSVTPAEEPVGSTSSVEVTTLPAGEPVDYVVFSNGGQANVVPGSSGAVSSAVVTCVAEGQVRLQVSTTASLADGGNCSPSVMSTLINCEPGDGAAVVSSPADAGPPDAQAVEGGASDVVATDANCSDQAACNAFVLANSASFLLTDQGLCTGTELLLYAKIVGGQSPGECLACAALGACLDDSFSPSDSNHECEDAPATTDAGAVAVPDCLATLACGLGVGGSCGSFASSPAPAMGAATAAYCGAGVSTADCSASADGAAGPQGACVGAESAGFPMSFTPAQVLTSFDASGYPSGMANNLLDCLNARCASQCFP
jgi:hypothetical protein